MSHKLRMTDRSFQSRTPIYTLKISNSSSDLVWEKNTYMHIGVLSTQVLLFQIIGHVPTLVSVQ